MERFIEAHVRGGDRAHSAEQRHPAAAVRRAVTMRGSSCAMNPKTARPAAPGRAHRAESSELLGKHSNKTDITIHSQRLAVALRSATLCGGLRHAESFTDREENERTLWGEYPYAQAHEIESMIVPFAYCWHFFACAGRSHQFNHKYPVSQLRGIIAECFGLRVDDVAPAAVLAALRARLCFIKPIRRSHPKDRVATITSTACPGDARRSLFRFVN